MNKAKVSIILPALNEAETIGKVIDEIPLHGLEQAGYSVEVLVVDNGSKVTDFLQQRPECITFSANV